MSKEYPRPLPLLRLGLYLLILGGCGAVTAHELYYFLAANTTTATVLATGSSRGDLRHAHFWADYEYFDQAQVRHQGHVENVDPVTRVGQTMPVQYLREAPEISRLEGSPVKVLSFGAVAVLAGIVFVGEILVWRRRNTAREEEGD